jgi:hypothetical protein
MNHNRKAKTPSDFVGPNVRRFRELRGYKSQRALVERLHELGATMTGWNQVKIHRLETGKTQRVTLEDLFELALALDVSPLQLIVPHGDAATIPHVTVGGSVDRSALDVKQWVRGVQPLLHSPDYRDRDEAVRGQHFYLKDSQPIAEWGLIAKTGNYASRVLDALAVFDEPQEEADDAE